jgi:hypothetical protein
MVSRFAEWTEVMQEKFTALGLFTDTSGEFLTKLIPLKSIIIIRVSEIF